MTSNNSLAYLKKRILDVLGEYYSEDDAVFVTDSNRDIIEKRMPDIIYSCLVRMYESVSAAGDEKGAFDISYEVSEENSDTSGYAYITLPQDFCRFLSLEIGGRRVDLSHVLIKDGLAYISKDECMGCGKACALYKKNPPVIDENTEDTFAFDLPPIVFEALICLCASELCREEDANIYTRLLYKYNDLYEGLCGIAHRDSGRNTFYKCSGRRRW